MFKQPFEITVGGTKKKGKNKVLSGMAKDLLIRSSLNRTKTTIKDIILCNHFELFCTFTFKDHRDDIDICKARMQYWLQSQQKQYGAFDYVIVPEFHKDGSSLHFHALFGGYKGRLELAIDPTTGQPFSTEKHNGRHLYNIVSYKTGFATAIPIENGPDDLAKVASYVTKYITKDMPAFHGKKRFWVSQNLVRPIKSNNVDVIPYFTDDNVQVFENDQYTVYVVDKTKADV